MPIIRTKKEVELSSHVTGKFLVRRKFTFLPKKLWSSGYDTDNYIFCGHYYELLDPSKLFEPVGLGFASHKEINLWALLYYARENLTKGLPPRRKK